MKKSRRRSKSIGSDHITTVLNSLTVEQLRAVGTSLRISLKGNTKDDIQNSILDSGISLNKILQQCFRAEMYQPRKHLFLAQFTGSPKPLNFPRAFKASIQKNVRQVKLLFSESFKESSHFLFEHNVDSYEMHPVKGKENLYRKERLTLRHAVSVTVDCIRKVILISYPGYTQGRIETRQRIQYAHVVSELLHILKDHVGLSVRTLKVRDSLNILSSSSDRRVIVSRTSPITQKGEMDLRGYLKSNASAADVLTNLIAPYINLDMEILSNGIAEALRNAFSETEIASWKKENVTTRITYWDIGAEFLFIWGNSSPSISIVNSLVDLIIGAEIIVESPSDRELWTKIAAMEIGKIFTLSELANHSNLSLDELREVLKVAIQAALVRPIFRLKSKKIIPSYSNEWIDDLSDLSSLFIDEDGHQIDGSDPENVEIAFRKSSQASEIA